MLLKDSAIILICSWVGIKPGYSSGCQSPHKLSSFSATSELTTTTKENHVFEGQSLPPRSSKQEGTDKTRADKHWYAYCGKWWGSVLASVMLCLLSPLLWRWWSLFINKSTLFTFHNRLVWKHSQEGDFWLGTSLVECGDPRPSFHKSHVLLKDPWQSTFLAPLLEAALLHFWWL